MRLITANVEAELHDLRDAGERAAGRATAMRRCSTRTTTARRSGSAAPASPGKLGHPLPERARRRAASASRIFRPRALRHAKSALHIALHWDGERASRTGSRSARRTR